jgi:predicted aldo/keto reductase-like oxidoreductase
MGGHVVKDTEQSHANRIVPEFIDRGVSYFDVGPAYGNAEERLGPALAGRRDEVFLACKTTARDRAGSQKELDASLKKLQTDRFDTYQLHCLTSMEQLEQISGPNGAMVTFQRAKEAGKTLRIGFSAHSAEVALAAMDRFEFDTILFPFNFVCWQEGKFGPRVLEKAVQKGMGVLALKAMALTERPKDKPHVEFAKCWYRPVADRQLAELALRFTLSRPITAAVPPGEEQLFRLALELAERFKPIAEDEESELLAIAKGVMPIFKSELA